MNILNSQCAFRSLKMAFQNHSDTITTHQLKLLNIHFKPEDHSEEEEVLGTSNIYVTIIVLITLLIIICLIVLRLLRLKDKLQQCW